LCKTSLQPNNSLLIFKIRRILSPEFKLNVESECSTDEITQRNWLKLARFEERAERVGKLAPRLSVGCHNVGDFFDSRSVIFVWKKDRLCVIFSAFF
jgi:hypothetical protein